MAAQADPQQGDARRVNLRLRGDQVHDVRDDDLPVGTHHQALLQQRTALPGAIEADCVEAACYRRRTAEEPALLGVAVVATVDDHRRARAFVRCGIEEPAVQRRALHLDRDLPRRCVAQCHRRAEAVALAAVAVGCRHGVWRSEQEDARGSQIVGRTQVGSTSVGAAAGAALTGCCLGKPLAGCMPLGVPTREIAVDDAACHGQAFADLRTTCVRMADGSKPLQIECRVAERGEVGLHGVIVAPHSIAVKCNVFNTSLTSMHPAMIALLPALDALLDEASVTRAAERMHVSPPAMSRTLTRLRELLQDPLLVRAGRGLVLTARGAALKPEVRQLVEQATHLLSRDETRLADAQTRVMSIRADDGVAALLGGRLLARAAAEAPGLVLRFVAEAEEDVGDLRHGRVDLDIGALVGQLGELRSEALFEDEWTLLMRQGHPLARGAMTLERLAKAEHVLASRKGRLSSPLDTALRGFGHARRTRLVVPTHLAGAAVVARSNAVMLMPASLARGIASLMGVRSRPLPLAWSRVAIGMCWHARLERDVTHVWLRAQVRAIALELSHA